MDRSFKITFKTHCNTIFRGIHNSFTQKNASSSMPTTSYVYIVYALCLEKFLTLYKLTYSMHICVYTEPRQLEFQCG